MADTQRCPSTVVQHQLLEGNASAADIEAFAQHLETCPLCAARLEKLSAFVNLVPQVKRAGQVTVDAPAVDVPQLHHGDASAPTQPHAPGDTDTKRIASPTASSPSAPLGYEILEELGRGGMGVVYKARQLSLNRLVAVKMVLAGEQASPQAITRFLHEAEAIGRMQHPNIVQVYEVGRHQDRPYFAMEFIDGGNLDKKLSGTPLPPNEAAQLVETLARAMQAAHDKGIIHRDLKPANILLRDESRGTRGEPTNEDNAASPRAPRLSSLVPKITDFGLAKKLEGGAGLTQSGDVMGTPSYMAPEQAQGDPKAMGPLVDVYALGAILYECLTGRPPFRAATPLDTLMQVVTEDPVAPSTLVPGLPADLETICLKCLHKEPSKRYASAHELAEDLRRFQAGEPILARPVGTAEHTWRWCQRNPGKLAAAVGALAVALALLVAMSARSASKAAALQKEIVAVLDEDSIQGSDEFITGVESLVARLEEIDAIQGEAAAKKLWWRLGQWVQREIRLATDAAEAKVRLQPTINRIALKNPELAEGLRKQIEDRLDRWDPVFQLIEPFAEVDTIIPSGQARVNAESLQLIPSAKAVSPGLVLTTKASPRNSEARVVFGYPAWRKVSELGLAFSASKKSGYTFVLRSGRAIDSSKSPSGGVEPVPSDDLHLQIRRNGVLLVQQKILAHSVGSGPVEIWAKREGMHLTCKLNQFRPLEFVDPFPLGAGDSGVFGLVARDPVTLTHFAAYRKSLPAKPGPLDQGDALYDANQFEDAIQHYRNQAKLVSDPELVQQAHYKEALCLVESNRENEAIGLLKEVSIGAGNRWPVLAECQLYLLLARRKDAVSQTEASNVLDRLLGRDQGQQSLATLLPDETRSALCGLDPSYFDLFMATNKGKKHHVRAAKQRFALEKLLGADPLVLMHGENLLLMAYRLAGLEEEAETFIRRRMGERAPFGPAPTFPTIIATTTLTHFYWILRTSGRASKSDLINLDFWRKKQPDVGLLLERARINFDLRNWADAEQDLNEILQAKGSNPVKYVEALCMKGFLRERAGDLKGAQDVWKEGIKIYHTVKRRPGDPFGENVMRFMNYWIMVSMAGEMSDEDCRGIQSFFLGGVDGDAQFQQLSNVASSLIPPAVIRETWRTARGRDLAQKWVFRQASYTETGLMPLYLIGAETLHHLALPGPLTPEHDQLIWELVHNGSRAYFDGKLGKDQIGMIGLTFKDSWFWAGVDKTLDPSVRGPTAYLLGHRYLKRDVKQAETFFRTALSSAPPGSVLQRLSQTQLDKLKKG